MSASDLRGKIEARSARIAIVGCGYVGLPLALAFAEAGFHVTGIDVDAGKVASLRAGRSYILDVPSEALASVVRAGRFDASTDYAPVGTADAIFVAVPTPFDRAKQPDLTFVTDAARSIARHLREGTLIVLESTTFPGTTDEVLKPILEGSGLKAGTDFFLAFSPERIDPGNTRFRIENTPKVVGGIDTESAALARDLLSVIVRDGGVHVVSSARAAELTKLLENTFRAVNIALVNELAMLCDRMDIDLWEVIGAAATKPYGFMPFYPGPGVGGHCIPVDPYYLSWKAREFDFHTKFIELAAETNLEMPFFTAGRIRRLLGADGRGLGKARILVLGAAFKRDVDDARNSPALRVMEILCAEGAHVAYHDPHVPKVRLSTRLFTDSPGTELASVALTADEVRAADCVAVLVRHSQVDYDLVARNARAIFDAVNAMEGREPAGKFERM